MTAIENKTDPSSGPGPSDLSSPQFPFSMDCSPFLNWKEETFESEDDQAVVFRSLVATVKLQAKLDVSLEAKAVHFLESVHPEDKQSVDAFLRGLASISDNSLASFTQSIGVLFSTPSLTIIKAAMKMLVNLIWRCSEKVRLGLVKADLNPQIIFTLHPLSLSFTEAVNIHTYLISTITFSFRLATQDGLEDLGIEDGNEQQSVHETVLKQVLVPLETYIWHLCVNRFSIIDGDQSQYFMRLLARLLRICPNYQPTMDLILPMPVVLTIPSCLTLFENEESICHFLYEMIDAQEDWNETRGVKRQMWKTVHRMLRMEGFEDVIEEKLQNDKNEDGRWIVAHSIEWNNFQNHNLRYSE